MPWSTPQVWDKKLVFLAKERVKKYSYCSFPVTPVKTGVHCSAARAYPDR